MTENRTPAAGQLYATPDGPPMLYVRTEADRPQVSGEKRDDHLFVSTRDRNVYTRWLGADKPLPDDWKLVADPEATARADALERELVELRAERDALVAAMKAAVSVVPVPVANGLRDTYRKTYGDLLTRGAR